jgi:hypothetical protein
MQLCLLSFSLFLSMNAGVIRNGYRTPGCVWGTSVWSTFPGALERTGEEMTCMTGMVVAVSAMGCRTAHDLEL